MIWLVVCRVLCTKVVGATSSEGFLNFSESLVLNCYIVNSKIVGYFIRLVNNYLYSVVLLCSCRMED